MDLLTRGLKSFHDTKHTCVITCPPDHRKLHRGDKILVLRPWERTPSGLNLGKYSIDRRDKTASNSARGQTSLSGDGVHEHAEDNIIEDLISSIEIDGQ